MALNRARAVLMVGCIACVVAVSPLLLATGWPSLLTLFDPDAVSGVILLATFSLIVFGFWFAVILDHARHRSAKPADMVMFALLGTGPIGAISYFLFVVVPRCRRTLAQHKAAA